MMNVEAVRVRVDAPGAAAAFALEKRLSHLHPTAVGRGPDWCVELEDSDDRIDEIEVTVAHWLGELGLRSTEVHVDGRSKAIVAHPVGDTRLGSGYDDGSVLEHEP